jgi:hypothetical protein
MFVHSVYFWLKSDLTDAQRAEFRAGLETLKGVPSEGCWFGPPAPSERPVVDGSYDFGLTVLFADKAAHDAYQLHPVHQQFASQFKSYWEKIVVYDHE